MGPASSPASPPDPERLLALVRDLACELRPGTDMAQALGLDHALERDYGLDSLARVELLTRIERELGIRLADAAISEAETPRDLLRQMGHVADTTEPPVQVREATPVQDAAGQPPQTIDTLTGLLDWHVEHHAERVHITFHGEAGHGEAFTYRMLREEALALATGLLAQGLSKGDRVAIMLPTGRDFFAAFYGTLYAGCMPVPLYPPARPAQIEDHLRRIAGIVKNAGAAVFITDGRAKLLGHLLRVQCESVRAVATVADLSRSGIPPSLPAIGTHDIAFLQYTSGSTGNPKGVILTHANLLANLGAMRQASGITCADVFVSWLPLYHDMGLIGACLGSLYIGFRLVLMSPLAFLARPGRWLWTIHHHRATVSAAPNFAYELCASKLADEDLAGLDLTCWRLAYNGAEPISPETLEHFAARFGPHGFNPTAMTPVYGLAESSVGLAFPPLGRGPLIDRVERETLSNTGIARAAAADAAHARRIVSCGRVLPGHAIRIVDASGVVLPERIQGRVQFKGPSATRGYFRNPEATARLFDPPPDNLAAPGSPPRGQQYLGRPAVLPDGDWLNTGDLGYLAAGELYLTGREKDIIIRGGHNIHPQELEEAVNQVAGVRRGGVAVFAATDGHTGTERLVVLAETRENDSGERSRIVAEINRLAIDLIGLPADDIVLAPPRAVLKTSSGKIRRSACRERYERGEIIGAQRAPWRQLLRIGASGIKARGSDLLKAAAGWAWSAWAWTVFSALVPLVWALIVLAPSRALRRRSARLGARLGLWLTGLAPQVEGLKNLAGHARMIVVANHASYLDALILTAVLPPRCAYVAKRELLKKPLAGIPLRRLDSAFVERFDSARSIEDTHDLEARARAGESLIFFPEGTFRDEPGLLPFRLGAFVVATHSGTPVIPITLIGTRDLLRGESSRPHYSKLRVRVNAPLAAAGEDWQAALQLRDVARRRILAGLGEADAAG